MGDNVSTHRVAPGTEQIVPDVASPGRHVGDTLPGGALMARSRLISCSLSTSARFFSLFKIAGDLAEFCQSLYPLIVVHSDDHGRMAGDAFTVKMKCHPSSPRSIGEFDDALSALDRAGLIVRAEHEGEMYLQVVGFDDFQTGLHKRRDSKFPELPGTSGKKPVELELEPELELNRTELEPKRTERATRSDDGFEAFWSAFPKKTGKGAAAKAWEKQRPPLGAVLESLRWQVGQPQWTKDRGQFIPHAATWLNQRRWEDEPFNPPQDLTPDRRDTLGVSITKTVLAARAARGEGVLDDATQHTRLLQSAFTTPQEPRR